MKINFISFILLVGMSNICIAQKEQSLAGSYPRPYMWAKNDPDLIRNFTEKKLYLIDKATRKNQPSGFFLGNFLGMLKYFDDSFSNYKCLHVYIGMYTGKKNVPSKSKRQIVLIFAPASSYIQDIEAGYYTIPSGKPFKLSNIEDFKIDSNTMQKWTNKFTNGRCMKALRKTIDVNNSENQESGKKYSDTRCITYCKDGLTELIKEQTYIHQDARDATKQIQLSTDMIVQFATYNDDESDSKKIKKRTFLQFDFTDTSGHTVLLENTSNFYNRKPSPCKCDSCIRPKANLLDNGQLCPPSENCPAH